MAREKYPYNTGGGLAHATQMAHAHPPTPSERPEG